MNNEVKNELTPKYRGIYDKAKTGHSMKSAIHDNCLRCMACKTKDIKNCENEDCAFHQYRPYQKNSKKSHRRLNASNLNRSQTGQILGLSNKSGRSVSRTVVIENPPEGRVRLKIEIEPEPKNKGK